MNGDKLYEKLIDKLPSFGECKTYLRVDEVVPHRFLVVLASLNACLEQRFISLDLNFWTLSPEEVDELIQRAVDQMAQLGKQWGYFEPETKPVDSPNAPDPVTFESQEAEICMWAGRCKEAEAEVVRLRDAMRQAAYNLRYIEPMNVTD